MARAESAGWLSDFRVRHHISGQLTQMILAGGVALVVLVAAVVALPRSSTKTATHATSPGNDANGLTNETSGSGSNVAGAGAAGGRSPVGSAGSGGSQVGAVGPGTTAPLPGGGHVSSRFIAAKAPGITKTTIYIAEPYNSEEVNAADRAIGAAGAAASYDRRNVFNAAADYANKHGGFAGRVLKPIFFAYNATDGSDTQDQSACAYWTQDNKVFVIDGVFGAILQSCAEKAHAVAFGGAATAAEYKKYPHLIDPIAIRLDRLARLTVNGLYRAHYFAGKLGMVTWDDPSYREVMKGSYLPTLAKLGVKVTDTSYIYVPQEIQALGDMTANVSSAVAKFKSEGIDHVIIQDGPAGVFGGTGLTLEWMDQAKSQRYYPRYGQNTGNSPGWDVLPSDQMDHAIAIDHADYDKKFDVGWHTNAEREKCFKIEADAGYPVNSSNLNDEVAAGESCDTVFFLQRVLNGGISLITNDSFISAAEQLGTSFHSAVVYGSKLVPGRRDGGGMMRSEEYFDSCKCLKFISSPAYSD